MKQEVQRNPDCGIVSFNMKHQMQQKMKINLKDCFQLACSNGHLKIAEMMINKAADLKINLNTKGQDGHSAFQLACMGGDLEIERSNCTKVV